MTLADTLTAAAPGPHRHPIEYRPLITEADQLALEGELDARYNTGQARLRHYQAPDAQTPGLAVETTDPAAAILVAVRLRDRITPPGRQAAGVLLSVQVQPVDPQRPEAGQLYYWPDITPQPCEAVPEPPSVGPHAPLDDTVDLRVILERREAG